MKTTIRTKNEFRSLDKHITDGKEYNVSIMATKTKPGMTLEKLAMTVEKLTQIVIDGFARQEEWNKKQEAWNQKQEKFNEMILEEIKAIKECPTIKKELLSSKKK